MRMREKYSRVSKDSVVRLIEADGGVDDGAGRHNEALVALGGAGIICFLLISQKACHSQAASMSGNLFKYFQTGRLVAGLRRGRSGVNSMKCCNDV
jgi:hypothetical protein